MTDSMKFGPEWLRNMATDMTSNQGGSGGGSGVGGGSSSSTSSSSSTNSNNNGTNNSYQFGGQTHNQNQSQQQQQQQNHQLQQVRGLFPEFRYGREEMLSLFNKNCSMPEILPSFKNLFIEKVQYPLALTPSTEEEIFTSVAPTPTQRPQWLQRSPVAFNVATRGTGRGGSVDRGRMRGKSIYHPIFPRPTPMFEDETRNLKPERGWTERNGSAGDGSSVGVPDWSISPSSSPRKDFSSHPTRNLENWRRSRHEEDGSVGLGGNSGSNISGNANSGLTSGSSAGADGWRGSGTNNFGNNRWGRSTSWRDDDGGSGVVDGNAYNIPPMQRSYSTIGTTERTYFSGLSKSSSLTSATCGGAGGGSNLTADSSKANSRHNHQSSNINHQWDTEDMLPEWAMENPTDSGGTFDASGAFHGSVDEEDDKRRLRGEGGGLGSGCSSTTSSSSESNQNKSNRNERNKKGSDKKQVRLEQQQHVDGAEISNNKDFKEREIIEQQRTFNDDNPNNQSVEFHSNKEINSTSNILEISSGGGEENLSETPSSPSQLITQNTSTPNSTANTSSLQQSSHKIPLTELSDRMQEVADDMVEKLIMDDDNDSTQSNDQKVLKSSTNSSTVAPAVVMPQNVTELSSAQVAPNASKVAATMYKNPPQKIKPMFLPVVDPMLQQHHLKQQVTTASTINVPPPGNRLMPPPITKPNNELWYYRDPQSKVQGPFTAMEMIEWYRAGYFDENLYVRRMCDTRFAALGDLIKVCGQMPFQSSHLIPPLQSTEMPSMTNTIPIMPIPPHDPAVHHQNQNESASNTNLVNSPNTSDLKGSVTATADALSCAVKNMINPMDMSQMLNVHFQMLQEQYIRHQEMVVLAEFSTKESFNRLPPNERTGIVRQKVHMLGLPEHLTSFTGLSNSLASLNPTAGNQLYDVIAECSKKDSYGISPLDAQLQQFQQQHIQHQQQQQQLHQQQLQKQQQQAQTFQEQDDYLQQQQQHQHQQQHHHPQQHQQQQQQEKQQEKQQQQHQDQQEQHQEQQRQEQQQRQQHQQEQEQEQQLLHHQTQQEQQQTQQQHLLQLQLQQQQQKLPLQQLQHQKQKQHQQQPQFQNVSYHGAYTPVDTSVNTSPGEEQLNADILNELNLRMMLRQGSLRTVGGIQAPLPTPNDFGSEMLSRGGPQVMAGSVVNMVPQWPQHMMPHGQIPQQPIQLQQQQSAAQRQLKPVVANQWPIMANSVAPPQHQLQGAVLGNKQPVTLWTNADPGNQQQLILQQHHSKVENNFVTMQPKQSLQQSLTQPQPPQQDGNSNITMANTKDRQILVEENSNANVAVTAISSTVRHMIDEIKVENIKNNKNTEKLKTAHQEDILNNTKLQQQPQQQQQHHQQQQHQLQQQQQHQQQQQQSPQQQEPPPPTQQQQPPQQQKQKQQQQKQHLPQQQHHHQQEQLALIVSGGNQVTSPQNNNNKRNSKQQKSNSDKVIDSSNKNKQLQASQVIVVTDEDRRREATEEKRKQKEERKRQQQEDEKKRLQLVEEEKRRQVTEEKERQKEIYAHRRKAMLSNSGSGSNSNIAGNGKQTGVSSSSTMTKQERIQTSVAPWSTNTHATNASGPGPSLAEIQKAERRERRADQQRLMELMDKQMRIAASAESSDNLLTWNAAPVAVKSLAEIQAEEAKRLASDQVANAELQRRREQEQTTATATNNVSSSNPFAMIWSSKVWGANNSTSGFWEEPVKFATTTTVPSTGTPATSVTIAKIVGQNSSSKQNVPNTSASTNTSSVPAIGGGRNLSKSQTLSSVVNSSTNWTNVSISNNSGGNNNSKQQNVSIKLHGGNINANDKGKTKASSKIISGSATSSSIPSSSSPSQCTVSSSNDANNHVNKHDDLRSEFNGWCIKTLNAMNTKVDVPTFVTFLQDLESPFEVKDYVRMYLGENKEFAEFAKQFLERRSKYKNLQRAQNAHIDDMCKPAPAINPSGNDSFDNKGKQKKIKKSKMTKLDARILGFSVTAAEGRINVGDRDYGDNP